MNKVHAELRSRATDENPLRLTWSNGAYADLPLAPLQVVEGMFRRFGSPVSVAPPPPPEVPLVWGAGGVD